MTKDEFIERISFLEPTFLFSGTYYTICHPLDTYYLYEDGRTEETMQAFIGEENLLYNGDLRGVKLIDAISEIDF